MCINNCKSVFWLFFLALICISCRQDSKKKSPSFYHWKSKMDLNSATITYIDSLDLKKLYVRFFDLHWDNKKQMAYPLAPIQWKAFDFKQRLEIIPTIYITNITLQQTQLDRGIDSLAKKVATKLQEMLEEIDTVRFLVQELQLDCDWSESTEVKYFKFLERLKRELPNIKTFSATIRLHQVKYYTTTGVPPVDKGVLMFYNMGNVANAYEQNSILNLKTAKKYLKNFKAYPLELDVALPLFAWGVQFRQKRIIQLINDVSYVDLEKNANFTKIDKDRFKALNSDYLNGIYIYKNDEIRIESVTIKDLKEALKMLRQAFGPKKKFEVIFYHLDNYIIENYNANTLQDLLN